MSAYTVDMRSDEPIANGRTILGRSLVVGVAVVAAFLISFVGCGKSSSQPSGTGGTSPPKPALSLDRLVGMPGRSLGGEVFVKPGHVVATRLEATAGETDRSGAIVGRLVDGDGASPPYPPLDFQLRFESSAFVPKKSTREFELLWPAPNSEDLFSAESPSYRSLQTRRPSSLREVGLRVEWRGDRSAEAAQRTSPLAHHQGLFVVLAEGASHYGFLGGFDALAAPHRPTIAPEFDAHYRLVFADAKPSPLLPTSYHAWSTAAYLLWDGFDATRLSDEQRRALVDWLHWGGTMIVVGPDTLDLGRLGPLAQYLPTTSASFQELDAERLAPLAVCKIDEASLELERKWPGVRMTLHPSAQVVTGTRESPLVVERRVGRGRIVATAFRPWQAELVQWSSYSGYFNTNVLRRPARRWQTHPNQIDFPSVAWADRPRIVPEHEFRNGIIDDWYDPARVTGLRYAGRGDDRPTSARPSFDGEASVGGGVAAWRDDDEFAATIRRSLQQAESLEILPAATVAGLLGFYVFLAVPVNWFLCRTFFKTEWAWIVLPVAAIGFTVVVVRAAGLDLGFVRTSAEVVVVELQPEYDRANVARFTSIYNSLGTTYAVTSSDPQMLAAPISAAGDERSSKYLRTLMVGGRSASGRTGGDGSPEAVLDGFVVDSNTVGYLRSEQTASLGGKISAQPLGERRIRLVNETILELRDVRLAGRGSGFVDRLPPGVSVELNLSDAGPRPGDEAARRDGIDVDPLWERFQTVKSDEHLRLTAWSTTPLPGFDLRPTPTQQRSKAVVVAHLEYAAFPAPQRDANARIAIERALGRVKPK